MNLSLLLGLVPLLAPAADQAALHPRDAVVFFAMPDVPGLVAAYGQAPLVKLLKDEQVHQALQPFGVDAASLDVEALLGSAIAGVTGGAENTDLIRGVQSLSFSASFTGKPGPDTAGFELVLDYVSADTAKKAEGLLRQRFGGEGGALQLPFDDGAIPGWTSVEGARLWLGGGTCTSDATMARAKAADKGLDGDALYQSVRAGLPAAAGTTIAVGFLRSSPWKMAQEQAGEDVAAMATVAGAFDPLPGPTAVHMALVGDRFVTETFSATTEPPAVLGVQAVDPTWLDLVPAGVMFAYGGTLDAKRMANLVHGAMSAMKADEQHARMAQQALPVFEKLGPNLVFYSDPIRGLGLPVYLWAELKSPEGFQEEFATALTQLFSARGVEVSTREYKVKSASGERIGVPITTLKLPEDMMQGPMNVSPSFAVLGGKLLAAPSSTQVKREIKRFHGGEPEEGEPAAGVSPFRAAGMAPPKDARSVALMDWGALFDGVLSLVKTFGGMAAMGGGELPFDPSQLPPAETFTRFFRPTLHWSVRTDKGLRRHHEASFGPETMAALAAAGFAAKQQFESQMGMGMGMGEPMILDDASGQAAEEPR